MTAAGAGPVTDVVAAHLRAESDQPSVTSLIHGSLDAGEIAGQVAGVLSAVGLSAPVTGCLFHEASVGSVTGVVLSDGQRLVVKAYQPSWRPDFLRGVLATQDRLYRAGVPCGRPIGGPVPCGRGSATIETFLADPGQPDVFGEAERSASADGLAQVITNAGLDERLAAHPLLRRAGGLYPTPHSPLFDFEATAAGAEWIDDLARSAKAADAGSRGDDEPAVSAHTDWSARNVRLRAGGVRAVYDLDSLAAISLSTAVGKAAVTWRALGEVGEPVAPGIDEIQAWIDRFPIALSTVQRRAAIGAALSVLCYTARCEHAIDPEEHHHHRARPRLREDGDKFRRMLRG
ncbi:MAG: hypothetical protein AAGA65_15700 [Actinomycetota bacterium]